MSDSSFDLVGTGTVGTADWLQASRGLTLSAYVPGETVSAEAPQQPTDGAASQNPNASDSVTHSS